MALPSPTRALFPVFPSCLPPRLPLPVSRSAKYITSPSSTRNLGVCLKDSCDTFVLELPMIRASVAAVSQIDRPLATRYIVAFQTKSQAFQGSGIGRQLRTSMMEYLILYHAHDSKRHPPSQLDFFLSSRNLILPSLARPPRQHDIEKRDQAMDFL